VLNFPKLLSNSCIRIFFASPCCWKDSYRFFCF